MSFRSSRLQLSALFACVVLAAILGVFLGVHRQQHTHLQDQAEAVVRHTFNSALAYVQKTTNSDQNEITRVRSTLSPKLYASLIRNSSATNHDQILCAQSFPDNLEFKVVAVSKSQATVTVTESFGRNRDEIPVRVDLATMRITAIACD